MHIFRMYNKADGITIGLFHSISVALSCVDLSWSSYSDRTLVLNIDGIKVERKGFEPIEYGFEPMRVITKTEHL